MRAISPTINLSSVKPLSEVETTEDKVRKIAVSALLGLLSFALIVFYASIGRPLWIDEFLHFAFGGFRSTVFGMARYQAFDRLDQFRPNGYIHVI